MYKGTKQSFPELWKVWNSDELLPKKIKSIMKITLLFLILGILHVSADTYAQKAQVTVEVKNGTFYDVVSEIEKQTEFMFSIRARILIIVSRWIYR